MPRYDFFLMNGHPCGYVKARTLEGAVRKFRSGQGLRGEFQVIPYRESPDIELEVTKAYVNV